jgi:hypothetical protein
VLSDWHGDYSERNYNTARRLPLTEMSRARRNMVRKTNKKNILLKCCGMEMNVDNNKVIRLSRQPSPVQNMTDQKELENVEYFNHLGSMITNDARCTREI